MLMRRLVVCLAVDAGRVVEGTQFAAFRDVGNPLELAERYGMQGADEVTVLDISASAEGRGTVLSVVRRIAERLFVPLTVGGGVRTVADVGLALRAGADKVVINSAAVARPKLLTEAAARFGAQCVVAGIEAERVINRRDHAAPPRWKVVVRGGRTPTSLDAVEWAQTCVARGAGEVLIRSIDAERSRRGYDIELTRAIADVVAAPVVASGGAGSAQDVCAVLVEGHADGALVEGIVHDGSTTVGALKASMAEAGLPVRVGDSGVGVAGVRTAHQGLDRDRGQGSGFRTSQR
jgi:cyclase